jgi:hypothetical protein
MSGAASLMTGRPVIWPAQTLTLSEAVALRDQGEAIRQIMIGTDPNRRYAVTDVFRPDEQATLTPLEAAVITRELHMVQLVVDYGAIVDGRNTVVLQCLADAVQAPAIREYLAGRTIEIDSCEGTKLPWNP